MRNIYTKIIVLSFLTFTSFIPKETESIKITANTLLKKTHSLSFSNCNDLAKMRNYLVAYQQLYNLHINILKNKSSDLNKIETLIKNNKECSATIFKVPNGFSLVREITIGGDGGGAIKGRTISPHLMATFYMSKEAKEAYLSNLPNELRSEYFNLKNDINNNNFYKSLIKEANNVKALDNKNYLNWYFQNNNNPLLKSIDLQKVEEFKLDIKKKTLEFKQN